MYQLANTLGIDSQKYALREKNENDENNNTEVEYKNNLESFSTRFGLTTFCQDCNKETVINKIDNQDKIKILLQCGSVRKLNK